MSWVDCGIAPSARKTVSATAAARAGTARVSAANGSTHQTYHGTVHASARTVASITAALAPTTRSRRSATAAAAPTTTSASSTWATERTGAVAPPAPASSPSRFGGVGGGTREACRPAPPGEQPEQGRGGERRDERVLQPRPRQPTAEHGVHDVPRDGRHGE